MSSDTLPTRVGITISPAAPGQVVALVSGGTYQRVSDWKELLGLLTEHRADLAIDPMHADEIVRLLNRP